MIKPEAFVSRPSRFLLSILAGGLLFAAACSQTPGTTGSGGGTEVVIFIDFSSSIGGDSRALFEQDLKSKIIPSLGAGDRILIAPITDKTLTHFNPLIEATFPAEPEFNGWLDNLLKYKQASNKVDAEVIQIKESIIERASSLGSERYNSPLTDIFSSLLLAERVFYNSERNKILVLMSDMIEDYPPYHFEKIPWSPEVTEQLLTELEGKGLIPNLSGVCVYVTGASAKSMYIAENIRSFWEAYFKRAKADMHPSRYAHVILQWSPSQSCSFSSSSARL